MWHTAKTFQHLQRLWLFIKNLLKVQTGPNNFAQRGISITLKLICPMKCSSLQESKSASETFKLIKDKMTKTIEIQFCPSGEDTTQIYSA